MFFFFMVKGMSSYFFFLILVVRFLFAIILCDLVFGEISAGKKTFLSSTDPERFSLGILSYSGLCLFYEPN